MPKKDLFSICATQCSAQTDSKVKPYEWKNIFVALMFVILSYFANAQEECGLCGQENCQCIELDIADLQDYVLFAYIFALTLSTYENETNFLIYFLSLDRAMIINVNQQLSRLKSDCHKISKIKKFCGFTDTQ